jgi:hypothetical protein
MKIRFWLLLFILMLMAGCASSPRPADLEKGSDYWNYLLYRQTADEPQGELRIKEPVNPGVLPSIGPLARLSQGR